MHRHTVYFAHNNPLRIDFSEWIFALDDRRICPKNTIDFSSRKVHTQISAQTNLISFLLFWRQIYFLSRFMLRIFLIYYLMVVSAAMVVVVTVPCWKVENTLRCVCKQIKCVYTFAFLIGVLDPIYTLTATKPWFIPDVNKTIALNTNSQHTSEPIFDLNFRNHRHIISDFTHLIFFHFMFALDLFSSLHLFYFGRHY